MAQYEAFDPGVEVTGTSILTVVEGGLAGFSERYREQALDALAEQGIEDPDPGDWYPQQAWLDTFETIAETLEPHLLDRLGERIPETVEWPDDDADGVPAALRSIDEAYRRNHRGGEIGRYEFRRVDDRTAAVECENPYPCEFDRGIVRAVARQASPVETFVFVEERGETCRRRGDDVCTYTVHW